MYNIKSGRKSLNAHSLPWSWKKQGSFSVSQISRHHGCPGHRTPVKTCAEDKTKEELFWQEKANICFQRAVWPQSEGILRKILGGHLGFVTNAFYVCPLILRSILGVTRHSFWDKDIWQRGYFKLDLSKCFSNKYNIQEYKKEVILVIYVRCMWVIWTTVGLWFRRNFSNLCGIFY